MFKVVSDIWNAHCTRNLLVITYYILARVLLIISTYYVYAYALPNNQLSSSIVRRRQHRGETLTYEELGDQVVRSQKLGEFTVSIGTLLRFELRLKFQTFLPQPKKCTHGTKVQQKQQQTDGQQQQKGNGQKFSCRKSEILF